MASGATTGRRQAALHFLRVPSAGSGYGNSVPPKTQRHLRGLQTFDHRVFPWISILPVRASGNSASGRANGGSPPTATWQPSVQCCLLAYWESVHLMRPSSMVAMQRRAPRRRERPIIRVIGHWRCRRQGDAGPPAKSPLTDGGGVPDGSGRAPRRSSGGCQKVNLHRHCEPIIVNVSGKAPDEICYEPRLALIGECSEGTGEQQILACFDAGGWMVGVSRLT